MADVNISKYRASVVRSGSTPATPGFVVSEGQNPVEPAGSEQNHLPVTINATANALAITTDQVLSGAGTVGQYIRGDGSLADFPASTGGGSSVSYYLNGSISQGTIGGVAYKELSKTPILGAGTQFTINADGYIASFLTDAGDPNLLEIPGGNWNFETYFSASSGGGSPTFYVELYKYDGSTFTLIASNSGSPELIAFGTNVNSYFSTLAVPTTALTLTDRLAIRYYVTHSGRTITLHTENNTLCQIITTFTTGLTALNGLTAQVQYFAVGTSGTDFNIASATQTHTFNLPTASASNRGALSSADWSTFNAKQNALTLTTTGSSGASTLVGATLNVPTYTLSGLGGVPTSRQLTINGTAFDLSADRSWSVGTVTSVGLSSATSGVTIGNTPVTGSGTITLAIATASGSQQGLLSSTDWTTFNNKQNALTNPVTGTGASGQVAYFNGTTSITSESALFWDATNDRLGIGITNPFGMFHAKSAGAYGAVLSDNTGTTGGGYFASLQNGSTKGIIAVTGAIEGNTTSDFGMFAETGGALRFYVNGSATRVMSLTSSGNLLVGTTTDNGARLQVSGTSTFGGRLLVSHSTSGNYGAVIYNTSATGEGLVVRGGSTSSHSAFVVQPYDGSVSLFNVLSTGAATFSSSVTAVGDYINGTILDNGTGRFRGSFSSVNTSSSLAKVQFGGGEGSQFRAYMEAQQVWNGSFSDTILNFFTTKGGVGGGVAMTINGSGNVGIGTSSPVYTLDVRGRIYAGTALLIGESGSGYSLIESTGGNGIWLRPNGVSSPSGMFLTTAGNVGIGTSSPSYKLQIRNDVAASTSLEPISLGLYNNSDGGAAIYFQNAVGGQSKISFGVESTGAGTDDSYLGFSTGANTSLTERMRITSSGNVGIGTTSPSSKLQIEGTGTGAWLTINRTDSGTNIIDFTQSGTRLGYIGYIGNDLFLNNATASNTAFFTNSSERMRITSGGNVLIGTTTDNSHKLRVNGTGYFDTGIKTGNPVGSTTNDWLLGRALVSGTSTPDRWIRVQIGNLYYDILAVYMGSV